MSTIKCNRPLVHIYSAECNARSLQHSTNLLSFILLHCYGHIWNWGQACRGRMAFFMFQMEGVCLQLFLLILVLIYFCLDRYYYRFGARRGGAEFHSIPTLCPCIQCFDILPFPYVFTLFLAVKFPVSSSLPSPLFSHFILRSGLIFSSLFLIVDETI